MQSAEKPFPPELEFGLMGDPAIFLRINEACSCLVRKCQRNSKWKSRGEIALAFSTEVSPRQQVRVLLLLLQFALYCLELEVLVIEAQHSG